MVSVVKTGFWVSCKYMSFCYCLGYAFEEKAKYWNRQSTINPINNRMNIGMNMKLIGF